MPELGEPTPAERALWAKWANDRAAIAAKRAVDNAVRQLAEPRDADHHARAIRRAIADAERDGMVVDFQWRGYNQDMHIRVVRKDVNWKKSVRIWPPEREI